MNMKQIETIMVIVPTHIVIEKSMSILPCIGLNVKNDLGKEMKTHFDNCSNNIDDNYYYYNKLSVIKSIQEKTESLLLFSQVKGEFSGKEVNHFKFIQL